jgi:hypothetical protein
MSQRYGVISLALAGALALGACFDFESPLDETQLLDLDPSLLGTWRCLPSDPDPTAEPANIVVTVARNRVYAIAFEEQKEDPDRYEGYASKVRSQIILNVRNLHPRYPDKSWAFARYSFLLPNVVRVEFVSDDALNAVEQSSAALRSAIEQLGSSRELFTDFCVCVRAVTERK